MGIALAAEPVLASTVPSIEIEEPMSPAFFVGDVCQKAASTWIIHTDDATSGCQDTTTCLQSGSHSLHDRSSYAATQYCVINEYTVYRQYNAPLHIQNDLSSNILGPIAYSRLFSSYVPVRLE